MQPRLTVVRTYDATLSVQVRSPIGAFFRALYLVLLALANMLLKLFRLKQASTPECSGLVLLTRRCAQLLRLPLLGRGDPH